MNAPTTLSFLTQQPRPAQPQSLLLLLHGVGANETSLAGLAPGIGAQTLVILPRGPLTLGPGQHAWFQVQFSSEGPRINAAQAESSRLQLIDFVRQLQAEYQIAPAHTLIAGFSQGGIMSASVALTAPDVVGAFAILSGRILPELAPHLADKAQLARLQAFVAHGEYDRTLPVDWAHRSDQLLTELGVPHQQRLYPMDHSIGPATQQDFLQWAQQFLLAR